MSLLKYAQEQDAKQRNGTPPAQKPLHFGRAMQDGVPFKGEPLPLRDEEFDAVTVENFDFDCGVFDMTDPAQKEVARDVMDKICNGLYRKVAYTHTWADVNGRTTLLLYLAWAQPYREVDESKLRWMQGSMTGSTPLSLEG